jgi:hypothetical protein
VQSRWPALALLALRQMCCKAVAAFVVRRHTAIGQMAIVSIDKNRCALRNASTPVNGIAWRNL